jgi:hypothetical protein
MSSWPGGRGWCGSARDDDDSAARWERVVLLYGRWRRSPCRRVPREAERGASTSASSAWWLTYCPLKSHYDYPELYSLCPWLSVVRELYMRNKKSGRRPAHPYQQDSRSVVACECTETSGCVCCCMWKRTEMSGWEFSFKNFGCMEWEAGLERRGKGRQQEHSTMAVVQLQLTDW